MSLYSGCFQKSFQGQATCHSGQSKAITSPSSARATLNRTENMGKHKAFTMHFKRKHLSKQRTCCRPQSVIFGHALTFGQELGLFSENVQSMVFHHQRVSCSVTAFFHSIEHLYHPFHKPQPKYGKTNTFRRGVFQHFQDCHFNSTDTK